MSRALPFISLICLAATLSAQPNDKPLLILYAFPAEGVELSQQMTVTQTDTLLGHAVWFGQLSGKKVIVAESGVGMTNAAMTTQFLIDKFSPRGLLFTGIAGAIDTSVHVGDIAVCRRWATHDFVYAGPDKTVKEPLETYVAASDSIVETMFFQVDSTYFTIATKVSTEQLPFMSIGDRKPKVIVNSNGVSGNAFIDNADKRNWLHTEFDAQITDMESAAVAQVCTANGVPYIIFRSSSDLAGGSKKETAKEQLKRFFEVAAFNSATLVKAFVGKM